MPGDYYAWITAPHFCAAIQVRDGHVIDAAPILRWTIGRGAKWVHRWADLKSYDWWRSDGPR